MVATIDVAEACKGVEIAVMVGGFPRGPGMERKEVMGKNVAIYKSQASVGPGRRCSPRHRMYFNSRDEGSRAPDDVASNMAGPGVRRWSSTRRRASRWWWQGRARVARRAIDTRVEP